jgi:hypothetical protein
MGAITVINVVDDWHADNTGRNDTSDQINMALAAVPSGPPNNPETGATVYFPRGQYLINKPLIRKVSFTRCVGEGKSASVILLDHANWSGTVSLADPVGSFMFDLPDYSVTDCAIVDLLINGAAGLLTSANGTDPTKYSGILCSARNEIARVRIYDVWGYGMWIFGQKGEWTTVVDCDADLGKNNSTGTGGNDTIGGGGRRIKVVRFYWMPTLAKNSALNFTAPGAQPHSPPVEVSVDIVDCINESPKNVVLEGCIQSTVRGNRFYGNNLAVRSDAFYNHPTVQNTMDVLVADNTFVGLQPQPGAQYIGGTCYIALDGGTLYCPDKGLLNNGGRIAILGNTFIDSAGANPAGGEPGSAIRWEGDDASNSDGGSIIHGNRIYNPNPNGITSDYEVKGGCGKTLGWELGCGIAVLSSYGLTISDNTINDTNPSASQKMQYSMQLFSSRGLLSGAAMGRIIVENNLCGSASGVGNGSVATFLYNPNESDALPRPILRRNTNQQSGYDMQASNEISGLASGAQWPLAGGYPYDAIVYVHGPNLGGVDIDGSDTGLAIGAYYLPASHHITIHWTGTQGPTVRVFRVGP